MEKNVNRKKLQKISTEIHIKFTILTNSILILYLIVNVLFVKAVFIEKEIIYFILGVGV